MKGFDLPKFSPKLFTRSTKSVFGIIGLHLTLISVLWHCHLPQKHRFPSQGDTIIIF